MTKNCKKNVENHWKLDKNQIKNVEKCRKLIKNQKWGKRVKIDQKLFEKTFIYE